MKRIGEAWPRYGEIKPHVFYYTEDLAGRVAWRTYISKTEGFPEIGLVAGFFHVDGALDIDSMPTHQCTYYYYWPKGTTFKQARAELPALIDLLRITGNWEDNHRELDN